jgi:hypothetical protein
MEAALLGGEDQGEEGGKVGAVSEQVRPGDRQPDYRDEAVAKGREAAKVMQEFAATMQSVRQTAGATPADMTRFEQRIMELAEQEERAGPFAEIERARAEFGQALRRDPTVRWLSTGANVFYPPAAVCILSAIGAFLSGATSPMHIYAEVSMLALGVVLLLYAGFSERR